MIHHSSGNCMMRQHDVNTKMRAILIDWLVDVHLKFKLKQETLFITVNLIDRFLEKEQVSKQKLQLIGVTAIMIAAKYEEIYPPTLRDYIYITDHAYTAADIKEMECHVLSTLEFDITFPTAYRFLER